MGRGGLCCYSGKNEGYLGMKMEPKGSGPCMYLNSEKKSKYLFIFFETKD
jgi:hypothetical protein